MAKFVLEEAEENEFSGSGGSFEQIPEGEYKAEVVEIKERVLPWKDDDGNDIPKIGFRFAITEGTFRGRQVFGDVNPVFKRHPNCKLFEWTQELLDDDSIGSDFELETDELVGLPCRIFISHSKKGREYVSDVMRVPSVTYAEDAF